MTDSSIFRSGSKKPNPALGGAVGGGDSDSIFRNTSAASQKHLLEAEIMAAINDLPALSAVVTQILSMVDNSLSSASDLEELVKQDMVIAGRLLKLVNSPFFGLKNPVSSITQAVAIIGMSSLKSLVVAASTSSLLMTDLSGYGFKKNGLWDNSLATGALSRHIAVSAGVNHEDAETYFLGGLMRDIGMLVLGPFLQKKSITLEYGSLGGESDIMFKEREALGFDHAWVGEKISKKWNLPPNLHNVITSHHQQFKDVPAEDKKIIAVVRLAERLAYKSGVGVEAEHPFDRDIDTAILANTGLDAEHFKEVIADVPEILSAIRMDF